jgi:hypothetical protein
MLQASPTRGGPAFTRLAQPLATGEDGISFSFVDPSILPTGWSGATATYPLNPYACGLIDLSKYAK